VGTRGGEETAAGLKPGATLKAKADPSRPSANARKSGVRWDTGCARDDSVRGKRTVRSAKGTARAVPFGLASGLLWCRGAVF